MVVPRCLHDLRGFIVQRRKFNFFDLKDLHAARPCTFKLPVLPGHFFRHASGAGQRPGEFARMLAEFVTHVYSPPPS